MRQLRGVGLLLITALIWGLGFAAQSSAADSIGSFSFTAVSYTHLVKRFRGGIKAGGLHGLRVAVDVDFAVVLNEIIYLVSVWVDIIGAVKVHGLVQIEAADDRGGLGAGRQRFRIVEEHKGVFDAAFYKFADGLGAFPIPLQEVPVPVLLSLSLIHI